MPSTVELTVAEWDAAIDRAAAGRNREDKLVRTSHLLSAAVQRSLLRGDDEMLTQLRQRQQRIYDLLDTI